jgi:hypothetical protein
MTNATSILNQLLEALLTEPESPRFRVLSADATGSSSNIGAGVKMLGEPAVTLQLSERAWPSQ